MNHQLATAANWDTAPGIMEISCPDSDSQLDHMTADNCDLEYWFQHVGQGTLSGLVKGHRPGLRMPDYMLTPGPLREAMMREMAFRSRTETLATRGLCHLIAIAPRLADMDFFVTQLLDEARHSYVFRNHILDLGVAADELHNTIRDFSVHEEEQILKPIETWALDIVRERQFYHGGVAIITVLLEGVLAPAAALSEVKWRKIDPIAADIEKGANIDEVRHLNVGANIIKQFLQECPEQRDQLIEVIAVGRQKWESLPVTDMVYQRELLFQAGLPSVSHLLEGYELAPGILLSESTAEMRMQLSFEWSQQMQYSRLRYMGFDELLS